MTTALWVMLILSIVSMAMMFIITCALLDMHQNDSNKDHRGVDAQFQVPTNRHIGDE